MKKLFILLIASTLILSCKKKKKDPEPETPKTVTVDGDYQEVFFEYLSYTCPNNQLTNTSARMYATPQGDANTKMRLNQGKIYVVVGTNQSLTGKYTQEYVIFNSNPNDTLFVVSQTSTELVTQMKSPVPCMNHTSTRCTFQI